MKKQAVKKVYVDFGSQSGRYSVCIRRGKDQSTERWYRVSRTSISLQRLATLANDGKLRVWMHLNVYPTMSFYRTRKIK